MVNLNKKILLLLLTALLLLNVDVLFARAGGGCFGADTKISTVSGLSNIQDLKPGDVVLSRHHGHLQPAKVITTYKVEPENFFKLEIGSKTLYVTDEHLFAYKKGMYKRAKNLSKGDQVIIYENNQWHKKYISNISKISTTKPAYNLLVDAGSTYLANNVLVHNKGCFLPDTPILLASGEKKNIRNIQAGDKVQAYEAGGQLVATTVVKVIQHQVKSYFVISTSKSTVEVTAEHPFYIGKGLFKTVEALKVGDLIYTLQGKKLVYTPVLKIQQVRKNATVYNLVAKEPHTYFASGIAVHNKGGGFSGGGGYHGSGNGDFSLFDFILFGMLAIYIYKNKDEVEDLRSGQELDFCYSRYEISRKTKKTLELIKFIGRQDKTYERNYLIKTIRKIFLELQACWMKRDLSKIKKDLMATLYMQYERQISGLKSNNEINILKDLKVVNVDLVNIRYTEKKNQREVTALITASARDYYVDDRNNSFIRGDKTAATFQEFWTFQLQDDRWLLREIEQAFESGYLKEENYVEFFTDGQIEKIYRAQVDKLGETGPWVSKEMASKLTKVERMLNFLVESNKAWDKHQMQARARLIFTDVHMAFEAGVLSLQANQLLFPDVIDDFKIAITNWNQQDKSIVYKNFCVRKVEIVLVKSFDDANQNEFVARISAHAQRIERQDGKIIYQDNNVVFFEEYWCFGWLDNMWKLKEVTLEYEGDKIIQMENTEEGSSPDMVKWYYSKKRAM